MKYILFEDFAGDPVPIIFPNRIEFEQMREQIPYPRVISAGFIQIREDGFACHGEARILNAASRPKDAEIIREKFAAPES